MIAFAHRRALWFGIAAVSAGVVLHLLVYVGARAWAISWPGCRWSWMKGGMALVIVGIALSGMG
jgi:hypothetical protein